MRKLLHESPATACLALSWVVVFVVMAGSQGGLVGSGWLLEAGIGPDTGIRFGAQKYALVSQGQLWRALTASFIHFSILHLLVNLFALIQLGPFIESWYGSWLYLAVCVVIAVLGNLLAAVTKGLLAGFFPGTPALSDPPSAGGSVILVGFIALLAVVGWRSRTKFGDYIRSQMVGILVFTALLGALLPILDNFGHAGGAAAGAVIGLGHRRLLRLKENASRSRQIGRIALGLIVVAAAAQLVWTLRNPPAPQPKAATAEDAGARLQQAELQVQQLVELDAYYKSRVQFGPNGAGPFETLQGIPTGMPHARIMEGLKRLAPAMARQAEATKDPGQRDACRALATLAQEAQTRRPSLAEQVQFERLKSQLIQARLSEVVLLRLQLGILKPGDRELRLNFGRSQSAQTPPTPADKAAVPAPSPAAKSTENQPQP